MALSGWYLFHVICKFYGCLCYAALTQSPGTSLTDTRRRRRQASSCAAPHPSAYVYVFAQQPKQASCETCACVSNCSAVWTANGSSSHIRIIKHPCSEQQQQQCIVEHSAQLTVAAILPCREDWRRRRKRRWRQQHRCFYAKKHPTLCAHIINLNNDNAPDNSPVDFCAVLPFRRNPRAFWARKTTLRFIPPQATCTEVAPV